MTVVCSSEGRGAGDGPTGWFGRSAGSGGDGGNGDDSDELGPVCSDGDGGGGEM